MNSVTERQSFAGTVLGMHATPVKPPAAAAAVPVATVSFHSNPGSRRCTCMSRKPGQTTSPARSSTFAPSAAIPFATRAILPSSIRTSWTASVPDEGSTTRPPLSSSFTVPSPGEEIEHGHPDGDPVRDLLEDDGGAAVGDVPRDLDPAVHGPGVHHDRILRRARQPRRVQPVEERVLAERREEPGVHPL